MVLRVISYCLRGIRGPYPGQHVAYAAIGFLHNRQHAQMSYQFEVERY